MAHFGLSTVTDAGNEMLNEMMTGKFITVTRAAATDATAGSLEELKTLTELSGDEKQEISIIDDQIDGSGRTITLQVTNSEASYSMSQIGVFAQLDGGEETLLYVMEEDDPDHGAITVPDQEAPPFFLNIYTLLNINNETGRFAVTIDAAGVVTTELLNLKLDAHNTDPHSHLIPDDNEPETKYRLGVEDGKLYMEVVEENG